MNDALDLLAERAVAWAKAYAAVTEALMQQGVPEDKARNEARMAAFFATLPRPKPDGDGWRP